jgi:predicted DNA-binding transcriptional regulator AlpA
VPSELRVAGLAEVAKILGVSKRTATRYAKRDDFPRPAAQLAMGPIWHAEDVEEWAGATLVKRGRPRSEIPRS